MDVSLMPQLVIHSPFNGYVVRSHLLHEVTFKD